jgi:uncharacterized protein
MTISLYASLLAILFFILSFRTIRLRRALKIGVGDAGSPQMLRAMRVHSNFAEYVPICLILIYMVESTGVNLILTHSLGAALLIGRLTHAYGFSKVHENFKFRVTGMALTFSVMLICSIYLLFSYINA